MYRAFIVTITAWGQNATPIYREIVVDRANIKEPFDVMLYCMNNLKKQHIEGLGLKWTIECRAVKSIEVDGRFE